MNKPEEHCIGTWTWIEAKLRTGTRLWIKTSKLVKSVHLIWWANSHFVPNFCSRDLSSGSFSSLWHDGVWFWYSSFKNIVLNLENWKTGKQSDLLSILKLPQNSLNCHRILLNYYKIYGKMIQNCHNFPPAIRYLKCLEDVKVLILYLDIMAI
ncbi:hypothetical protein PHYBLDRAFT_67738 [Phycomyces blakesleeanus NRRL 1555(-)]|uniref:Uncharacterized protein n=1 Tax=Phycomyces blakesleeanus (strain ATCC 8743b / DSM 1359 / FGSC 10004 / NBRC 33097 / NRRL 1555) TaxID=763407 RepID=A0A162UBD3_PHYB8|nr:hypothetical protein PHYBLDRAFT_67738 [Phycomyces blakesleeanus NRRL 1555(-)]OAD74972.1 hypothetical protein PHYBLDRAFT_67738 [Phycomyces blakesleeanus NRRL 1555(-)]|eukprot:XP_018293012.1 hypothetical protein PHYBLDRAFT_67738 [Phycomyces blakesleeanus NRRL 1555(-)]